MDFITSLQTNLFGTRNNRFFTLWSNWPCTRAALRRPLKGVHNLQKVLYKQISSSNTNMNKKLIARMLIIAVFATTCATAVMSASAIQQKSKTGSFIVFYMLGPRTDFIYNIYGSIAVTSQWYTKTIGSPPRIKINHKMGITNYWSGLLSLGDWTGTYYVPDYITTVKVYVTIGEQLLFNEMAAGTIKTVYYIN